jgi:hypothetical protein
VGGLRPTDIIKRLIKRKGASLTWGPGPSNGLGSGATTAFAVAAVAAAVVAATGAPGGDRPRVLVAAANPAVAVVVVAADLMVAVAEG